MPMSPTRRTSSMRPLGLVWRWTTKSRGRAAAIAIVMAGFAGDLAARRRQSHTCRMEEAPSQHERAPGAQIHSGGTVAGDCLLPDVHSYVGVAQEFLKSLARSLAILRFAELRRSIRNAPAMPQEDV